MVTKFHGAPSHITILLTPHVHITIRGLNEYGGPLFIPKKLLLHGCRIWAREIVTNYLGERTDDDIVNAYLVDAVAHRFTKLDFMSKTNANDNNGIVDFQMFHAHRVVAHGVVAALGKRLDFLEKMGLAEKSSLGRWILADDLHEILREHQIQNDIVRRISNGKTIKRAAHRERSQTTYLTEDMLEKRGTIFGRILFRELRGDFGDKADIYIEDRDGDVFTIPGESLRG